MPGDVLGADLETMYYIRSEAAFNIARMRGSLDVMKGLITRRNPYLLPFRQAMGDLCQAQAISRGLRDVPVRDIVGSVEREREFSRRFHPLTSSSRQKERWRLTYTMSLAGKGFPPIEVCKAGRVYFVLNGHHRVSVARYLNWEIIQAYVSEVPVDEIELWDRDASIQSTRAAR
jgi:hypothetical protein